MDGVNSPMGNIVAIFVFVLLLAVFPWFRVIVFWGICVVAVVWFVVVVADFVSNLFGLRCSETDDEDV